MKSLFFDLSIYSGFIATLSYILAAVIKSKAALINKIASFVFTATLISGVAFIIHEWIQLERPPFSNTFEVLVLLAISLAAIYLVFEYMYKGRFYVLGPFVSFLVLASLTYATLFNNGVQPLMPALRNNFWLTIHVLLCFVSYAGLFISFVAGILHLFTAGGLHRKCSIIITSFTLSTLVVLAIAVYFDRNGILKIETGLVSSLIVLLTIVLLTVGLGFSSALIFGFNREKSKEDSIFEQITNKSIMFSFPLLGAGIIAGSVWANEAWGSYWQWDPKETWALITWLIYFVYIHLKFMKEWRGARLSWIAVIGFYAVIFTFFGVNYVLSGLHSYA
ncbi:MAG: c-type cytochrome biogenesis protein CcsB [Planctomycetes bacterium]|nr:c-type cytochrome biogenesis protein CcsB [Planctomycetota bacterium]